MKKTVFLGFFFYLMIAMLVVGWLKMFSPTLAIFGGVEWAFWATHTIALAIWSGVGAHNDYFYGRN